MARLALIGGGEFSEGFRDVHAELLAGIGGAARRVVYLPTCAADDGPEAIEYWCAAAREKLSALGAQVETPPVIDLVSANDERHARLVAQADWIYWGGRLPARGHAHLAGHACAGRLARRDGARSSGRWIERRRHVDGGAVSCDDPPTD